MSAVVTAILTLWGELLLWVLGFAVVFGALAKWRPCNPEQSLWRKDAITDLVYCFVIPVLNRFAYIVFLGVGVFFLFRGESQEAIIFYMKNGYGPLSQMPLWSQAAVIFILSDFMLYWLHRWFHGKTMWRFHAIHHSSPQVDWMSTYRFHPINTWLSFALVDSVMVLIGFSPAAVATMASFNIIYSAMVHANVNWTFGPFKYVFASPVFHRWHHTAQEEGRDKNFAPTFPLLDIMFGTFYMPEGETPRHYGVPGSNIPSTFFGQLIWPFRKM